MKCKICNLQVSSYKGLAIHLRSHKIDVKNYYDTYIKQPNEGFCTKCNKETTFISLAKGYSLMCNNCKKSPNQIICVLCGKQIKNVAPHFYNIHKISPKDYYDTYLKKDGDGICKICNKPTSFISIAKGYRTYCPNPSCAQLDEVTQNKKKQNAINKYGVTHTSQRQEVKDKQCKTCLAKYGVTSVLQRSDIHEKALKKSRSIEAIDKRQNTMIERYGVDTMFKDPIVHMKAVQASRKPEINEKRNSTNLEKYGHINPFGGEKIKNKIYETNIKKYGAILPAKNCEIKQKIIENMKQTNLERYGVTNYSQTNEFKEAIRQNHKLDRELDDADE